MGPREGWNLEAMERHQQQAVDIARSIVQGELGIIAGCRKLSKLAHGLVEDWRVDPDFVVFGNVESDTDHLPLEDQRPLWNPPAFEEKQRDVASYEESARAEVVSACRSVIARFGRTV